MNLVQGAPEDRSARPKLYSFRKPLAGDVAVATQQPVILDVLARENAKVAGEPFYLSWKSIIGSQHAWWSADGSRIYFIKRGRFAKSVSLNVFEPATGRLREILRENSDTWVRLNGNGGIWDPPAVTTLRNGDVVWYSERDGWGHLYYYDGRTGVLRNQITQGDWGVRSIVGIDENRSRIYFMASGREIGRDPYEQHLYSVNYDGSGLRLLTPEDADHGCEDFPFKKGPEEPASSPVEKDRFSPSGRYFIDCYSRPDQPPVAVVRRADGRLVKELERADISPLRGGGYTAIEPFKVIAADGKTPIYGNLFRPSTFDPTRRYPVIDAIYPGPQIIRTVKSFDANFDLFCDTRSLAELGFLVVTIDGRGTPHRSRQFLDYAYGHLDRASDLRDHIAAIRELAQRYSYMDLDRVGITGTSGGGYASARAMLAYPDFYKVAVSAEGNHDQRADSSWGEFYLGEFNDAVYRESSNMSLAGKLKGRLLLMHGDLDDNTGPDNTIKLVAALIDANRDFDLLIMPNGNHSSSESPYFIRRKWDYFVRNLLGAEPPAGYEIAQPPWVAAMFR